MNLPVSILAASLMAALLCPGCVRESRVPDLPVQPPPRSAVPDISVSPSNEEPAPAAKEGEAQAAAPDPKRDSARPDSGPARPPDNAGIRIDLAPPSADRARKLYPWTRRNAKYEPLSGRITAPEGFERIAVEPNSYAHWLRHLPLLPPRSPVKSYRGKRILSPRDDRLAAVVDLDLSRRDRQQCADTVMRMRGEYLHAVGNADQVSFRWPNIGRFGFQQWRQGSRPAKVGRRWRLAEAKAKPCSDYECFRNYLEHMFSWTGTMHLQGERKVDRADLRAGDFFIQGGSPGHVVIVLDLVKNDAGELRALIGQGFMPAQDMHVMRPAGRSPWFKLKDRGVSTPFWQTFRWRHLRRSQ